MKRLAISITLLASACSPYIYENEIGRFSTATKNFTDGLANVQADFQAEPELQAFWAAYADPDAMIEFDEQSCDQTSTSICHILVNGTAYTLSNNESLLIKSIAQWKAVTAYAESLKAVTNADDSAAFDAASSTLSSSAASLVGATVPYPAAGPAAAVAVRAGTAIFGFFLDKARLDQLRASVIAVDKYMPEIQDELAKSLKAIRDIRIADHKLRIASIQAPLTSATKPKGVERERLIKELQLGVARIAALQRSKPDLLADKMVAAHGALAAALARPKVDLADVVKTLDEFVSISAEFKSAFATL